MRYAPVKSAGPGLACGIGYKGSPSHATNRRRSLLSRKLAKAWQKDDADTTRVLRCKCYRYGVGWGKNNNELTKRKLTHSCCTSVPAAVSDRSSSPAAAASSSSPCRAASGDRQCELLERHAAGDAQAASRDHVVDAAGIGLLLQVARVTSRRRSELPETRVHGVTHKRGPFFSLALWALGCEAGIREDAQ